MDTDKTLRSDYIYVKAGGDNPKDSGHSLSPKFSCYEY